MTFSEYLKHGPYVFPGAYTLYAVMDDGEMLCYDCCKENRNEIHENGVNDGWRFITADVYWEGPDMFCAHCNKPLKSEYGDPDEVITNQNNVYNESDQ